MIEVSPLPQKRAYIQRKPRTLTRRPSKKKNRATGKNKPKRTTLRLLKKKLEAVQKQVTIKRFGRHCYTCPQRLLEGSNCQLGHVPWPRSVLSQQCIFDVRYTRIQCFACNIHRGGMGAEALRRMQKEGIDVEAMRDFNQETKGTTTLYGWYEAKIAEYEKELGLSTET